MTHRPCEKEGFLFYLDNLETGDHTTHAWPVLWEDALGKVIEITNDGTGWLCLDTGCTGLILPDWRDGIVDYVLTKETDPEYYL